MDLPIVVMKRTYCEADHNARRWLRMMAADEMPPQDKFDVQWGEDLEEWEQVHEHSAHTKFDGS